MKDFIHLGKHYISVRNIARVQVKETLTQIYLRDGSKDALSIKDPEDQKALLEWLDLHSESLSSEDGAGPEVIFAKGT